MPQVQLENQAASISPVLSSQSLSTDSSASPVRPLTPLLAFQLSHQITQLESKMNSLNNQILENENQVKKIEEETVKIEKEKEEHPSLVSHCVDWARTHGLKRLTLGDIDAYILERNLDIQKETRRALYAMANIELKSKK